MKKGLTFLLTLCLCGQALSQNMDQLQVDKLKSRLASSTADTIRALTLGQLAEAYRDVMEDSSLMYGQEALALSRSIGFIPGEVKSMLTISYHYYLQGDLTRALDLGLRALELARKHNLWYDQAFAMIRIGNVYLSLKDYREALSYYMQTRRLTTNSPDTFFHAVTYWRAADAYLSLHMIDSAIMEGRKAEDTAMKIGNQFIQRGIAPILGEAYGKKGMDSLALSYFWKNLGALSKVRLATFYLDRGRVDSAIFYAENAFQLAEKSRRKEIQLEAARLLSELYAKADPATALYYSKVATGIQDSVYGAEKTLAAKSVAVRMEEQRKELLIADMAWRNKLRIWIFTGGLASALLVAFILFRNNRHKQRINKALEDQKEKLETALSHLHTTQAQLIQSEKMSSLGELTAGIAHEIQNPLNFVNNFSDVNQELIDELKDAIQKNDLRDAANIADNLKENESKINMHGKRADSIVKSMLQHSRGTSGQQESVDINKLVDEYVRLAFHGYRAKVKDFNVELDISLDPSIGNLYLVRQDIGRVVLNLLNNAFYAVADKARTAEPGYKPLVTIRTAQAAHQVTISIEDNGPGIPEDKRTKIFQPFFTTKPTGDGTGLGLSLSYDIITKGHNGQLICESKEGEFTRFSIIIPRA